LLLESIKKKMVCIRGSSATKAMGSWTYLMNTKKKERKKNVLVKMTFVKYIITLSITMTPLKRCNLLYLYLYMYVVITIIG